MGERTTIALLRATRDELARFGRKGESYDALVRRLLVELHAYRGQARRKGPARPAAAPPQPGRGAGPGYS